MKLHTLHIRLIWYLLYLESLLPSGRYSAPLRANAYPRGKHDGVALINVTIDDASSTLEPPNGLVYSPHWSWTTPCEYNSGLPKLNLRGVNFDQSKAYRRTFHLGIGNNVEGMDGGSCAGGGVIGEDSQLTIKSRNKFSRKNVSPSQAVTLEFSFNGTAIYIYSLSPSPASNAQAGNPSSDQDRLNINVNLSLTLDNVSYPPYISSLASPVPCSNPSLSPINIASKSNANADTHVLVLAIQNLSHTPHKLVVTLAPNSVFAFDYLVYSTEAQVQTMRPRAVTDERMDGVLKGKRSHGADDTTNESSSAGSTSPTPTPAPAQSLALLPSSVGQASTAESTTVGHKKDIPTFAGVVGGIAGVLFVFSLCLFLSLCIRRRRAKKREQRERAMTNEHQNQTSDQTHNGMVGPAPFIPRYFPGTVPPPQPSPVLVPPPYSPPPTPLGPPPPLEDDLEAAGRPLPLPAVAREQSLSESTLASLHSQSASLLQSEDGQISGGLSARVPVLSLSYTHALSLAHGHPHTEATDLGSLTDSDPVPPRYTYPASNVRISSGTNARSSHSHSNNQVLARMMDEIGPPPAFGDVVRESSELISPASLHTPAPGSSRAAGARTQLARQTRIWKWARTRRSSSSPSMPISVPPEDLTSQSVAEDLEEGVRDIRDEGVRQPPAL